MLNYNLKLFSYEKLFKHFVELEKNNKLPLRIMLTGQDGIGKSLFAFHFVNYLLSKDEITKYDLNENKINPESKSFNLINNLSHPNFYLISVKDGKKNIEIEQIRNMLNFLNKSTFDNNKKIILIDGAEDLNLNSSNALLKCLEDSNTLNLFILTYNINKKLLDTIKSRCLNFKLNFDYSQTENILSNHFGSKIHKEINEDFRNIINSPKFMINHINFARENNLDLRLLDIKSTIQYIIDNKSFKKSIFISSNIQSYIEIYFTKMYSNTRDYKYYDNYLKIVTEKNLVEKFNLDLDSFYIKFENKYLNN